MKDFSKKRYLIGQASFEVRLIYTFFLIFLLVGFLTIAGYEFARIGFSPQDVTVHYVGDGADQSVDSLHFPKEFQELLDTAHFHAFIMAMVFMTLAHLFIATTPGKVFRLSMVCLAFACTLLDVVLPMMIRFVWPGFASVLMLAWIGEWISYMAMILVSLYDIWIKVPGMAQEH